MLEVNDKHVVKIDCQQGLIRAVRFNAEGQYAMTCGSDRTIKLWRPSKLLQLKCYKGHSSDVIDCQANHDSSQFVSCSNDRSLIVWDVESGKILRRFRNMAPFSSMCYGPNDNTILAGSIDGTVRIYDLRSINAWEPIQTLVEAKDSITSCKAKDSFIYSTSLDKCLRTYDIRKGSLSVDTLSTPLNHIALSQDSDTILVTCLRGPPLLIDRSEANILSEYTGNVTKLFKLESTFTLGDTCIASGSEDNRVYIWDIANDKPKLALQHSGCQTNIVQSISSDSLDLLLTSCGNYMFMWSL